MIWCVHLPSACSDFLADCCLFRVSVFSISLAVSVSYITPIHHETQLAAGISIPAPESTTPLEHSEYGKSHCGRKIGKTRGSGGKNQISWYLLDKS